jgi:hypothetical protein
MSEDNNQLKDSQAKSDWKKALKEAVHGKINDDGTNNIIDSIINHNNNGNELDEIYLPTEISFTKGGTDISAAFKEIENLNLLNQKDAKVIFITDGEPVIKENTNKELSIKEKRAQLGIEEKKFYDNKIDESNNNKKKM